ncbi:rhodanese-like domain-containing protein [Haloglomus irregulare]|jgi:rhodanese-related sulfurtransferase|uniref:Rhodanese-like domain-containing protein n=1 Tax=Haloglomus irregulare TaxID=2234134 RepID=A0A554NBJ0_9EURY|nr:rhodanese-like domain-containing protein [Haloglomus irregulare]TSD14742.1 rhodanese-like domain-containing protein [Haloglomus irregulare]
MDDEISAAELHDLLEGGADVRVVDIRSADAFRRGRLPNSENIPFPELTGRIEELADADHVVTVCPHGEASVQAARLVASYEGFDGRIESMADGITGWAEQYGLESASSRDGDQESGQRPRDAEMAADGEGDADEGPEAPF